MRQHYLGEPDKAHRLNAARRAAGFASVKATAMHFGWPLATYRGHEGATRRMPEATARVYAKGLGVDFHWLWEGRGRGPQVDQARIEKYKVRARHAERSSKNAPLDEACVRLRIARRLAGVGSVTDAAKRAGIARSTIASHESGQNRISKEAAAIYAAAYGANAEWIRTGAHPSGYPAEVTKILTQLGDLHHSSEKTAMAAFPTTMRSDRDTSLKQFASLAKREPLPSIGDTVPEVALRDILECLSRDGLNISELRTQRTWWFPDKFLREVMSCDPKRAIVVVARNGDRIIVDASDVSANRRSQYAVIGRDGVFTTDMPSKAGQILGRACGILAAL